MKVGIVVPFSWSYWGGVVEHAENQADALRGRGHEVKLVMGNDPPGRLTRLLHPRTGRQGQLPPNVIPVGRSVVVPANASLTNIVLTPRSINRIRDVLAEERFDLVHLHEPMTPAICVATLALARCPIVATWHAAGELGWMRLGMTAWGFLMERIDCRIAVSRMAAESAEQWLGGPFEIVPNGVVIPEHANAEGREHHIVFIGRHDTRKGLPVLLRAWPEIRRRTGARLRLIGTDPLQYRFLHSRMRFDDDGIDVLGIVTNEVRSAELASAKVFVSPALGGESFGLVLAEAFATATPVVASDIPGFADVATPEAAVLVPPGDEGALTDALADLLADEERRVAMGRAARELAVARYSWSDIARRLEGLYEQAAA
jgi:phosphatidylinositol alpha-mannosyltransferase